MQNHVYDIDVNAKAMAAKFESPNFVNVPVQGSEGLPGLKLLSAENLPM